MRSWIALAFGGADNPYGDVPTVSYSYDDNVQNHKQVAVGDILYVRGHGVLDGIGRIARIEEGRANKSFRKCPTCQTGRFHNRAAVKPTFKCHNGHEFDEPHIVIEEVRTFKASFDGQWLDTGREIVVSEMRPFELRDSKQLAIMPADTDGLANYVMRRRKELTATLTSWLGRSNESLEDREGETAIDITPTGMDERQRVMRSIRQRRGQSDFRDDLIERYGGRCVVSDSRVLGVLEAAHIRPYRGPRDNHPANGLLLRGDLHTLFDLDRIGIDPGPLTVQIAPELIGTEYDAFRGKRLFLTSPKPDKSCLRSRWKQFEESVKRSQSR